MILEEETFKQFGYYPRNLKPKSGKKILAKCDECGKIREIFKYCYKGLCKSCRQKGERHYLFGKHHSEATKQKISETEMKKVTSEKTKKKMRDNHPNVSNENNPNWKGGISFEPYCEKFDDDFKERVREFWNRKCVLCNKTEKENKKKMFVHHVTYNKDTCCDNSIPLFVILCNSCHSKTNSKRQLWQDTFEKIIHSRNSNGKCFYNKEEMENVRAKNLSSSNKT